MTSSISLFQRTLGAARGVLALALLACLLPACKDSYEVIRKNPDPEIRLAKAQEYYEKEQWDKAQYLLEELIPYYRGTPKSEIIYFLYAYTQYRMANYTFANYYFKQYFSTFPNSKNAEEALYMCAYSEYKLSPVFRLDQSDTKKAIEAFELFINTYPASTRLSEVNILIDELRKKLEVKAVEEAELYFRISDYQAATRCYENVLKDFPDTNEEERIRYMLARASYRLAENSVIEKQVERYRQALNYCADFLSTYPESSFTKEVKGIQELATVKLQQAIP